VAYSKTTWIARIGTFLNRFTKTNESGSSVDLTNDPTITTAGTPFSVGNMNKIEQGIFDAAAAADANTVKTNTLDGTGTLQGVADGDGPTFGGGVMTDNVVLKTKIVEIGDWDMDTAINVSFAHGLTDILKIRSVSVLIVQDAGSGFAVHDFNNVQYNASVPALDYYTKITSTLIALQRDTGGYFDNTNFNATSYNRGYVTIIYEA